MSSRHRLITRTAAAYRLAPVIALAPLVLAGCAAFPTLTTTTAVRPEVQNRLPEDDPSSSQRPGGPRRDPQSLLIPGAVAPVAPVRQSATTDQITALIPDELVDASLAPQTIPQFVSTVFGGVLGLPYTMSPDAAVRTEIIAGGTGGTVSKRDLFRLTQQALSQYGLEVYIDNGFVTVGRPEASGIDAELTRGRTVSGSAGRVVQFFPVQTIDVNSLQTLLQDLFPSLTGARITVDPLTNSLIVSGPSREVAAVIRVLRQIDQPRFAGAEVLRIEPSFLSATDLSAALEQTLTTEGYIVSTQSLAGRSITMLTFASSNQILVFAQDPALLSRVRFWVDTLDRPASLGDQATTFVYQVRNTDAQSLGQLAIGQAPTSTTAQAPVGVPGTAPVNDASMASRPTAQGATGTFLGGRLLTDPTGNRILFTGKAADYAQLRTLLDTLDQPSPQVVIEVIIAEVTITDSTSLGISLFGTEARGDGLLTGGTEGINVSSGGLLATFIGPEFRARLNAEASNNRINILQRPQIVARSGGTARFQVGSDVPIITSQRATDVQSGTGSTDILQSVQYRQTGVILDIKPVIYGDRVDLTISQEISSAGDPPNAAIASPTILNRSLTTQIALSDGWTGVLGGLISNNYTTNNVGVPFLKDLPIIGQAFQSSSVTGDRTELLVMITPHIVRNDEDMADFAERYSRDMNAAFQTGRGWSYTLTPIALGSRFRGVGFNLPTPGRASETQPLFGPRLSPGSATPSAAPQPEMAPAQDVPATAAPVP